MKVRCGKGHYHNSVAEVRACYNGERVTDVATEAQTPFPGATEEPKPTAKQLSFIESLLKRQGLVYTPGLDSLNRRSASAVIDTLKGANPGTYPDFEPESASAFEDMDIPGLGTVPVRKAPAFDPETLEDGFYALPDPEGKRLPVVYKVIVAVHGSGRKYAKRLNTDTGEWDMARGSISLLRPEHKMTLQQAMDVAKVVANDVNGALYGRCFKCGRTLTNEDSIERFMGPVCADSFN